MMNQHGNANTIGFDVIEVITKDGDAIDHDPLDYDDEDDEEIIDERLEVDSQEMDLAMVYST
jgi:hypothetical protein